MVTRPAKVHRLCHQLKSVHFFWVYLRCGSYTFNCIVIVRSVLLIRRKPGHCGQIPHIHTFNDSVIARNVSVLLWRIPQIRSFSARPNVEYWQLVLRRVRQNNKRWASKSHAFYNDNGDGQDDGGHNNNKHKRYTGEWWLLLSFILVLLLLVSTAFAIVYHIVGLNCISTFTILRYN